MAVTNLGITQRSASVDNGNPTYTHIYKLESDSATESEVNVLLAVNILTRETAHPVDTRAICSSKTATQDEEDGRSWTVQVVYTYPEGKSSDVATFGDVTLSYSWISKPYITDYTIDGAPIVNAAGDPFSEPVELEGYWRKITATRNEFTAPTAFDNYHNKINADTFLGYPAESVRFLGATGQTQEDPDFGVYWANTYEFEYRPEGFKKILLNKGKRAIGDDGKLKDILGADLFPVTEDQLLDEDGKELNPLVDGARPDPEELKPPVFLAFEVYQKVPFAVFGF